jgi:glycerol-3-phosphate acyltransferase PlsY
VSPTLYATLWLVLGFLCGSIPFGYIVARAKGMDIRTVGSGNIGMTNVWRTLGARYGVLVLVLDALKGWLPVFLLMLLNGAIHFHNFEQLPLSEDPKWQPIREAMAAHWPFEWLVSRTNYAAWEQFLVYSDWEYRLPMLVALAAVLGHTFSPWMKFKGGKGVATGLGVILALYAPWSVFPALVFVLALALSRYVSLASILASITVGLMPLLYRFVIEPQLNEGKLQALRFWPHIGNYWPFGVLVALLVVWTHRENIKRIANGTERKVGAKKTG